jgi:hypothetical protein
VAIKSSGQALKKRWRARRQHKVLNALKRVRPLFELAVDVKTQEMHYGLIAIAFPAAVFLLKYYFARRGGRKIAGIAEEACFEGLAITAGHVVIR